MNHDPMCTWQDFTAVDCHECDLLAKVRADERAEVLHAAEQAVAACGDDKGYIYSDTMTGVEWALDAIRALKEKS